MRFDAWRLDIASAVLDPTTGWLTVDGTAAVVGVLDYGTSKEFVPATTLQSTAADLITLPVTLNHPGAGDELLTSKTTRGNQVGTVIDAKFVADALTVRLRLTDALAIAELQAGKRELSPGYDATIERKSGEYQGQRYDAVQIDREYNHLALVDRARAGRRARVDAMGTVTIEIDGVQYQVPPEVAAYIAKLTGTTADAAPPPPPEADPPAADMAKKMDAHVISELVKAVSANVVKEIKADRSRTDAAARELGDTVAMCRPHLPQSYRTDGKDRGQILHDAIVAIKPEMAAIAKAASSDIGRLQGMFDVASAGAAATRIDAKDAQKTDASDDPVEAARKRQNDRLFAVAGGKK